MSWFGVCVFFVGCVGFDFFGFCVWVLWFMWWLYVGLGFIGCWGLLGGRCCG